MGRTARYKKVKQHGVMSQMWGMGDDGFRPKKRSRTAEKLRQQKLAKQQRKQQQQQQRNGSNSKNLIINQQEGYDLDPTDDLFEEEAHLQEFLHAQKPLKETIRVPLPGDAGRESQTNPSQNSLQSNNNNNYIDDDEYHREAKQLLNTGTAATSKASHESSSVKKLASLGRQAGESRAAYDRRTKAETRQIIKNQKMEERNPEKKRKKKEFLNNRKKKKKNSKQQLQQQQYNNNYFDDADNYDDDKMDNRNFQEVRFGEQVERPPIFKQLPRGANKNKSNERKQDKKKKLLKVEDEQNTMEQMRKEIQARYALIKAKRKRDGDFHL